MASVRNHPDGRLVIKMMIADPTGCAFFLFGWFPGFGVLLTFMLGSAMLSGQTPILRVLPTLLGVVGFTILTGIPYLWTQTQSWEFNPAKRQIIVRRGPLVVRTESLDGLQSVRVDIGGGGDGDSGQARLGYSHRPEVPVNRTYTGSYGELITFARAVNRFLGVPEPPPAIGGRSPGFRVVLGRVVQATEEARARRLEHDDQVDKQK